MKRQIRFPLLTLIGLTLLFSCEKQGTLPKLRLCDNEYFYYSANSKISLQQSPSEIWIVFEDDEITREGAASILSKYPFLDVNLMASRYNQVGVTINENVTDCAIVNNYLKVLNEDDDILSATPRFYFSDNDPDSYFILLSEVLVKNNENLISEPDFIDYAETINLELMEAPYTALRFKVKEVKTGFEALEISNRLIESGKVQYAHPNFMAKLELQ